MSTQPVTTTAERTSPRIFVEVSDGRLVTIQLARSCLDRQLHDEVRAALRATVAEALQQHSADTVAAMAAEVPEPMGTEQRRVLEFRDAVQADVEERFGGAQLPPADDGYSDVASGSDAHGDATAVLRDGILVDLDFHAELLDRDRTADVERAVRDAVNAALASHEQAVLKHVDGVETTPSDPSVWADLARTIDRLERGLV